MEKNELTKVQEYQVKLFDEMATTLKLSGCELTEYGKKCAVNCIAGVISFLQSNGKTMKDVNQDLLKISIQNVALTELNYASLPAEIYFDLRGDILTIKPQGAGNEKLVRTYGVDVKSIGQCWLIREGDDFVLPSYDGLTCVPPKWTRKTLTGKVIAVCYPVTKNDGNIEWLISGREEVVANLIAQIRQNALHKFYKKSAEGKPLFNKYGKLVVDDEARQKFYDSLEDRTLDDLLADETLKEYINPTYTSGGSREAMIIRKMKNNALKNYPREYNNSFIKDAVVNMFEEQDSSVVEKPNQEIVDVDSSAPKDFDVDDNGEVKEETAETKPTEEPKAEEKPVEKEEPKVEEQKTEETKDVDDDFGF